MVQKPKTNWQARKATKISLESFFSCWYSVAKSCPTLCNPMDYNMPGFPVFHCLLPHRSSCSNSCPLNRWCYLTISASGTPFSFCLQLFPASGSFPVSQLFTSGGSSVDVSAPVLPMNIQGGFPLGLTGLILQSKGLSRVFSSTTIRKHQVFGAQPSLWSSRWDDPNSIKSIRTVKFPLLNFCYLTGMTVTHLLLPS